VDFLISGQKLDPYYLVTIGFLIGVMGGFFGVGGSFLAGPALFAVGVPWNFVIGTDLAHIVGKSIVAAKRHRALGNVDIKLGAMMVAGTISGVEVGADLIQYLKRHAHVDIVVGLAYIVILMAISTFMAWEGWKTIKMKRGQPPEPEGGIRKDESAFGYVAKWVQGIRLWPMVSLPASGIEQISFWVILVISFVGGFFSGFLGGGAGYIRMPAMVYLLGIPTHVAVGTDLFEIILSASYGTLTHAVKGNVDIMIALVMNTGAAIGAQIGAISTQYFGGPKIRLAFVPLPILGAGIVIYGMIHGHKV